MGVLQEDAAWGRVQAPDLVAAHLRPCHRAGEGRAAGLSGRARAMIDVSDGLLGDLGHLCAASEVAAEVRREALPLHPQLLAAAQRLGRDPLAWVQGASDDYELILTCVPDDAPLLMSVLADVNGVPVTEIGRIVSGAGTVLVDGQGRGRRVEGGWDHFGIREA